MGLRTKLKNIIKKKLGRETAVSTKQTMQYQHVGAEQKQDIQANTPLTPIEVREPTDTVDPVTSSDSSEASEAPVVQETPAVSSEPTTSEAESQAAEASPDATEESADTQGAFAVSEIKTLFPEVCPHCGASSHNNWKYVGGSGSKFACGSCNKDY